MERVARYLQHHHLVLILRFTESRCALANGLGPTGGTGRRGCELKVLLPLELGEFFSSFTAASFFSIYVRSRPFSSAGGRFLRPLLLRKR